MCALLGMAAWTVCAAAPAKWERILSDEQGSYYLDSASIQSKARVRTFWSLRDYKRMQSTYDGKAYQSTLVKLELNCASQEATALEITYFTGKMLSGDKVLRESDFHNAQPVQGNSPITRFAKRLCP
jgi:hypothetical protein